MVLKTNTVSFRVEAARTESILTLLRVDAGGSPFLIYNGEYSENGEETGRFLPLTGLTAAGKNGGTSGAAKLTGGVNANLTPASEFLVGESIILHLDDNGHNISSQEQDFVFLELESDTTDALVIRMFETGENTGIFTAAVPTTMEPTSKNDGLLTVTDRSMATANYQDTFDQQDTSVETAQVSQAGRVIHALSQDPIDGVTVTLIDESTGRAASFPENTAAHGWPTVQVTGQTITHEDGDYDPGQGGFLFPSVPAGRYRIQVDPPTTYVFPSINAASPVERGEVFTVDVPRLIAPIIPLDTVGDFAIAKMAGTRFTSRGDIVNFTVSVTNRSDNAAHAFVKDMPDQGFRLILDTVRVDGAEIDTSKVLRNDDNYLFDIGVLNVGSTVNLKYAMTVDPDAPMGRIANSALVVDGADTAVSNRAYSEIVVQDDLLRDQTTLIGRVSTQSCAVESEENTSHGIPGIRVMLENGDYVISDERGLFSFTDLKSGTHVVRLDPISLPIGAKLEACDGTALPITKFIDAAGGSLMRANFKIKLLDGNALKAETVVDAHAETKTPLNPDIAFGQIWLDQQKTEIKWIYPAPNTSPSGRSTSVGILHPAEISPLLFLNGKVIPSANLLTRDISTDGTVVLTRWRGVDIQSGKNTFEATFKQDETALDTPLLQDIWFSENVLDAVALPDASNMFADGQSEPEFVFRAMDAGGRPVHPGRIVKVDILPPYRMSTYGQLEIFSEANSSLAASGSVVVEENGLARIRLEPTLEAGPVDVRIMRDQGDPVVLQGYIATASRPWIVTGLAELRGSKKKQSASESVFKTKNRAAFFGSGEVYNGWQMTVGLDTEREKDNNGQGFSTQVNPEAGYQLLGDASQQERSARTSTPFYARLEKERTSFSYGDILTGLSQTELGRYARRLTGVKATSEGKNYSVNMFAAEAEHGFRRVEIPADGTSGPYMLPSAPILTQSETIQLVTRGRVQADQIINTQTLERFVDYDLDLLSGELIFSRPIIPNDDALNPVYIIIEYETLQSSDNDLAYGGRAALRTANRTAEVGVTYIQDSATDQNTELDRELIAADAKWQVNPKLTLRGEYAFQKKNNDTDASVQSNALLAEAVYASDNIRGRAWVRREDPGFGAGQQAIATGGTQRYGVSTDAVLRRSFNEETGTEVQTRFIGQAYREENLQTDNSRQVVEGAVSRDSLKFAIKAGLRQIKERFTNREPVTSTQVFSDVRKTFEKLRTVVTARVEETIGNSESALFPRRFIVGLDTRLFDFADLRVRQEWLGGSENSGQNTTVGFRFQPLRGMQVHSDLDRTYRFGSDVIGANYGVDQTFKLTSNLRAQAGLSKRSILNVRDEVLDLNQDTLSPTPDLILGSPLSGTQTQEGFVSGYGGLDYQSESVIGSVRVEFRDTQSGTRYVATGGVGKRLSDSLSLAGTARLTQSNPVGALSEETADVRFGFAWRPENDTGLSVLNQLNLDYSTAELRDVKWKIINNLAVNYAFNEDLETTIHIGTKYTKTNINDDYYSSWSHLLGADSRWQATERFDLGLGGYVYHNSLSKVTDYAISPNVGFRPHDNIWVSAGYTFHGLKDRDFEAATHLHNGPFMAVRLKFDESTISGLIDTIAR